MLQEVVKEAVGIDGISVVFLLPASSLGAWEFEEKVVVTDQRPSARELFERRNTNYVMSFSPFLTVPSLFHIWVNQFNPALIFWHLYA